MNQLTLILVLIVGDIGVKELSNLLSNLTEINQLTLHLIKNKIGDTGKYDLNLLWEKFGIKLKLDFLKVNFFINKLILQLLLVYCY